MTTDLSQRKCEACSIDTPPMQQDQIVEHIGKLDEGWTASNDNTSISRTVVFKDFNEAMTFTNKVAGLAEEEGHHPDIFIHNYKKVRIDLMTHKIKGLSLNDFILAAKIDELL